MINLVRKHGHLLKNERKSVELWHELLTMRAPNSRILLHTVCLSVCLPVYLSQAGPDSTRALAIQNVIMPRSRAELWALVWAAARQLVAYSLLAAAAGAWKYAAAYCTNLPWPGGPPLAPAEAASTWPPRGGPPRGRRAPRGKSRP